MSISQQPSRPYFSREEGDEFKWVIPPGCRTLDEDRDSTPPSPRTTPDCRRPLLHRRRHRRRPGERRGLKGAEDAVDQSTIVQPGGGFLEGNSGNILDPTKIAIGQYLA